MFLTVLLPFSQEMIRAMPLPDENEIHQLLQDQSLFYDFEIDLPNVTDDNELDPSPEVVNNNMNFSVEQETSSVIRESENSAATNQRETNITRNQV